MTSALSGRVSKINFLGRWQYLPPSIIVLFTLALILVPLAALVYFSFRSGTPWEPGELTLDNYINAYTDPQTYSIFFNTAVLATFSTAISVCIAVFFAYLTERTDLPFRNLAWGLMLIPMAMPGLLFAVSWTFLLSPQIGIFNVWIREISSWFGLIISTGPFNIYGGMGYMIFLEGLRGVTTAFLIIVGGVRAMDPSLEEAARASGASNLTTQFRVTFPLLAPIILAATIYSFMTHLESLEIPIIIGLPAKVFVFPSYIFFTTQRYTPPEYGLSSALSAAFLILSILLVFWYRRVVGQSGRHATVTGKGYRPRIIYLGKWRSFFFSIFVIYFLLSIGAPAVSLIWSSLLPIPMAPSLELIEDLSFQHYIEVFNDPDILDASWNTILVAVGAGTLTMVLSLTMAWVIVRNKVKGGGILDGIAFVPQAIPGIVIGVAFIYLFSQPPMSHLNLFGTLTIIVLGLTVSYLAFGSRTMNGALSQIHVELEEAGTTSGAKWRTVMRKIVLPLMLPAFISGWIWVATHALRNFSIPLLLTSHENKVISVIMWHSWDDGYPGQTAAIGVCLIIGLGVFAIGGRWLVVKLNRQEPG